MSGSGPRCPWGKAATPGVILIDCYLDTLDTWQKSGNSFICLSVCVFVFVDTWQNPAHGQVPMSFDHSKASPSLCVCVCVGVLMCFCTLCVLHWLQKNSCALLGGICRSAKPFLLQKKAEGRWPTGCPVPTSHSLQFEEKIAYGDYYYDYTIATRYSQTYWWSLSLSVSSSWAHKSSHNSRMTA